MTLQDLRDKGLIILECISGSRAYGLATPESDTDIKGVFLLPKSDYYGLEYMPQVSNETNDVVFYELGRFLELLSVNNPNILELLNTPAESVVYKHPFLADIKAELFLSKLCANTFGRYAISQIKKARGLNKKIVNPMAKARKSVLDFCFVNHEQGALPLTVFLKKKGVAQSDIGLSSITNMPGVFGVYHHKAHAYKGVMQSVESNDISLSSIPKGEQQLALLYFNKNGYSTYCKKYKEYWDWVAKRNEVRYESTVSHGQAYDAKNMMHTLRLLDMAIEIGSGQGVNVKRPNRDFLLYVKKGAYTYEELTDLAAKKQADLEAAFASTELVDRPDMDLVNKLAFELRERFYEDL